MKLLIQPFIKSITLLTLVAVAVGCKSNQEFFEKMDLETISTGSDNGTVPNNDDRDNSSFPVIKDDVCVDDPKACDLTPVVGKPGVVTMLLALGDLVNNEVVITEGSARLLAQNSVKYATPVSQPKILVVKDINHNGESPYDTEYIATVLLANYKSVDTFIETYGHTLKDSDVAGYDLIWFNNPGHSMGTYSTMQVLMSFKGGVILSGDDLTQGSGFNTSSLTGLKYIDNGTSASCNNRSYYYDNNGGERFKIDISNDFLPGISEELRHFEYGNDIDRSVVIASSKVEVLAFATDKCNVKRPTIVRYEK